MYTTLPPYCTNRAVALRHRERNGRDCRRRLQVQPDEMESMNDEWWTGIIRLPILGSLLPPSLRYRVFPVKKRRIMAHAARGRSLAGRFKLQALPDRNMRRGDWGVRSGWAGQVQTRRRPLATLERHVLGTLAEVGAFPRSVVTELYL